MSKVIGINFNYSGEDLKDGVFRHGPKRMENRIHAAFAARGVEVHTVDMINPRSDDTIAVIYFDFNWKHWLHDTFLRNVPFKKRVLVLIEPATVNPTAYYIPFFRKHFSKVFTYDEILLKKNPTYLPHIVLPWGEFEDYRENKYRNIPFSEKKLLCSISKNRWSYMPQSTYRLRKRAYHWFEKKHPCDFDLYGIMWNKPVVFYQRWFGYPKFTCCRGQIYGTFSDKMDVMARYKFALCFENSANRPGYISEKIRDCLCARTVPIYYGAEGIERHVPRECFINFRDFKSFDELDSFITSLSEADHAQYIAAADTFINSDNANYFSAQNFTDILVKGILG